MAKEYIDKEAAIKLCVFGRTSLGLLDEIKRLPAADVRENVIRTQADSIRAMSDEELADVFDHVQGDAFLVGVGERKNSVYPGAGISWLDWLKSPVEVEE